jgi:hypothetical protein
MPVSDCVGMHGCACVCGKETVYAGNRNVCVCVFDRQFVLV